MSAPHGAPQQKSISPIQRARVTGVRGLGIYDVALGGQISAVASLLSPAVGVATELKVGQEVIGIMTPDGAWYIPGVPAAVYLDPADQQKGKPPVPSTDRVRMGALLQNEIVFAYPDKSSGLHCFSSGVVELSTSTPGKKPDEYIQSKITLIPIFDAVRITSRRAETDAAAGQFLFLHDDDTGDTAVRLFARTSVNPSASEKRVRLQFGTHEDVKAAVASLIVYPKGILPPKPPDIKGALEKKKYADSIEQPDRKDWATRFRIEDNGKLVLELANVPAATLAPTVHPTFKLQIEPEIGDLKIDQDGSVEWTVLQDFTLDVVGDVTATVLGDTLMELTGNFTVTVEGDTLITCPNVRVAAETSVQVECPGSVSIGIGDNALPIVNQNTYDWLKETVQAFLRNHRHPDPQGGLTSPPADALAEIPAPEVGMTVETIIS